jgi:hypothetical protein
LFYTIGQHTGHAIPRYKEWLPAACSLSSAALARLWLEPDREGTSKVGCELDGRGGCSVAASGLAYRPRVSLLRP